LALAPDATRATMVRVSGIVGRHRPALFAKTSFTTGSAEKTFGHPA
jgi:hypothetical protein